MELERIRKKHHCAPERKKNTFRGHLGSLVDKGTCSKPNSPKSVPQTHVAEGGQVTPANCAQTSTCVGTPPRTAHTQEINV